MGEKKNYNREKWRKGAGHSLRQIYSVAKIYVFLEQKGEWQIINAKWWQHDATRVKLLVILKNAINFVKCCARLTDNYQRSLRTGSSARKWQWDRKRWTLGTKIGRRKTKTKTREKWKKRDVGCDMPPCGDIFCNVSASQLFFRRGALSQGWVSSK